MSEETKILELGRDRGGMIRILYLSVNGVSWPTETIDMGILALKEHEIVIRTDDRGVACVYRRDR